MNLFRLFGLLGLLASCLPSAATASQADVVVLDSSVQIAQRKSASGDFRVLARSGNLLRVEANVGYDRDAADGSLNVGARQDLARASIDDLGDHYDFIIVAPSMAVDLGPFRGLHWQVHNDIQGIGRPSLDLTGSFGSGGRLKAVIDLDDTLLQTSATAVTYDDLLDTLMHEVMHQWAAYVPLEVVPGDAQSMLSTTGANRGHWSSRYDSAASVMFGARWQALEDGRYRQSAIRDGYGPLDLYLAGFIAASDLPDTRFLLTTELQGTEQPELGRTVAASTVDVTRAQLIAILGPRVPESAQSQRTFTAALVLLEAPDHPSSPAQLDRLEVLRVQAQSRFSAMTQGRARLQLGVAADSTAPARGAPVGVGSSLAFSSTLDLANAANFLVLRQNEGIWRDKRATEITDTLRVMQALAGDPTYASVLAAAATRAQTLPAQTLEQHSTLLRIPGLSAERRASELAHLLAAQRPDGGFALGAQLESSTLDTALALLALSELALGNPGAVPIEALNRSVNWLQARWHGGRDCWSLSPDGPCDLLSTVYVVRALASARGPAAARGSALLRWETSQGGFGSGFNRTPFETAIVLNSLTAAGMGTHPVVEAAATYLASQQREDGSWAGSVAATAEALAFFQQRQRPDLRFEGPLLLQPSTPIQGQRVVVSFNVRNAGSQPAPATSLLVEVRPLAGGNWQLVPGLASLPALDGQAQIALNVEWITASVSPGDYLLRVRLDTQDVLAEFDETNNVAESQVALGTPPTLPDLTIAGDQVELTPNVVTSVPQGVRVRCDVENLGLTAAGPSAVRIFGWRFGELVPLRTTLIDVAAQSRISVDETVEIIDPEVSRIVVTVDSDHAIAEANEGNNRAEAAIAREPTVDLSVSTADIVVPANARVGTPTSFSISLRNLGTSRSPLARVRVEIVRSDASTLVLAEQDVQIDPAATVLRSYSWTPELPGNSRVRVTLDPDALIPELREDNNTADSVFEVLDSSLPNLLTINGSWVLTPNPALQGMPATIGVTVGNSTAHAAPTFVVEFSWADPGASTWQTLGTVVVDGGLPPGANRAVSIATPPISASSPRQLRVRLDPGELVTEANETDNTSLNLLPVLSRPNLQLAAIDTLLTPTHPAPGAAVRLTSTVRNSGQQSVASVDIELRHLTEGGAVPLAAVQTLTQLAPGEARAVEFQFSRPGGGASARIELSADRSGAILEGREDDNQVILDLDVIDPDFFATELYISPNGDGIAEQTEIVARLSPPAEARLRIVSPWGEEVATFGDSSSTAQLNGIWDGRRADGRRALDDRYDVLLEDAEGRVQKRLQVTLDTNRWPLVLAARDGRARLTRLGCGLNTSSGPDAGISLDGLDFAIAVAPTSAGASPGNGLYRVEYDGSPPRLLLPYTAIPGAQSFHPFQAWLEDDGATAAVVVNKQLVTVDVNDGRIVQPPTAVGSSAIRYIGRFDSGYRVFQSSAGLVALSASGQLSVLYDDGDLDFDYFVPVVGRDRVLVRVASGAATGQLRLVGEAGAINVPTQLLAEEVFGTAGVRPPTHYSRFERAFYWASGPVSVSNPDRQQRMLRIDESDGEVTTFAESTAAMANLTLSVSPSGERMISVRGADASAELWSLRTGARTPVDLHAAAPDVTPIAASFPIGRTVAQFYWAPDESHVAARFEAYQDTDPEFGMEFAPSIYQPVGSAGLLIDSSTGELTALGTFQPRGWVNGELQLLGEQEAMAVERGRDRGALLPATSGAEIQDHWPFLSDGLTTMVHRFVDPSNTCDRFMIEALSSTANGLASFSTEYVDALRTLVVNVSADDLNLARYSLAYQLHGDTQWTEIFAGTEPVDDATLGAWSPPAAGRYRVRLRVLDLAGNAVETEREIVWFSAEPLGLVKGDQRVISPNGDGVKDQLSINYELRSALDIAIRVEDANGTLIRLDQRVHAVPGSFQWQWDGKQVNGQSLADGAYRVVFADRVLTVTLDSTAPQIGWSAATPGSTVCYNLIGGYGMPRIDGFLGTINATGSDQNWRSLEFQSRPRGSGSGWTTLASIADHNASGLITRFHLNVLPAELRSDEFRLVGTDLGGNRAIQQVEIDTLAVMSARILGGQAAFLDQDRGDWHTPVGNEFLLGYRPGFPPSGVVLGLLAADTSGWQLEYSYGSDTWVALPFAHVPESQLTGDLQRACFGTGETWVEVVLPNLAGKHGVLLRFRHGVGAQSRFSNHVLVSELVPPLCFENPETPVIECPAILPDVPIPAERDVCEAVGVETADLGITAPVPVTGGPPLSHVSWTDPRTGEAQNLTVIDRPVGSKIRVSLASLPLGEHRVVAHFADGAVQDSVIGKRTAIPATPTVDRPLDNGRLCLNVAGAAAGSVGSSFVSGVELFQPNGRIVSGAAAPSPLPRPDGLTGFSIPNPWQWQTSASFHQELEDGPGVVRIRSIFCDTESDFVERQVIFDQRVLMQPPRVGRSLDNLQLPTVMIDGEANSAYLFSPDLGERAWIAAQAYEQVRSRAVVRMIGSRPILTEYGWAGTWEATGEPLADLGELQIGPGQLSWSWDGRGANGALLPDGDYLIEVQSRDECGNESMFAVPVGIDGTPPVVQWLQPDASASMGLFQNLRGRVSDAHPDRARFEYSALVGNGQWVHIGERLAPPSGAFEPEAQWYSNLTPGPYRLRLTGRDSVGHESSAEIEVLVPQRSPMTAVAELGPELISPNGDQILDQTQLQFVLSRSAIVTLQVRHRSGTVLRTLDNAVPLNGAQSRIWNGTDSNGTAVIDGDYRLYLHVVDPDAPANVEDAYFDVAVDTTPPQITMLAPSGAFSNGRGALLVDLNERNPSSLQVSSIPPLAGMAQQHTGSGTLSLVELDEVAEGNYVLSLRADDLAGNRSATTHSFTIDRNAPTVSLSQPAAGAVVTRNAGPIAVLGNVEDTQLAGWQLQLLSGAMTSATLASVSNATNGPISAIWNGTEPDGAYQLRLIATDRAGNDASAENPVILDNTPPLARIDTPATGALVGLTYEIRGSASDANFDHYEIDISPRPGSPAFQRVAERSEAVVDGVLASTFAPNEDGAYLLRLRVYDRAGQLSEAYRDINVDTVPPPAPPGLQVVRAGARDAQLSWTSPGGSDLSGYHVYRGGQRIATVSTAQHLDPTLADGRYDWRVTAFDLAGNESDPSNSATLTIDTTPPDVAITAPVTGARRGGQIVIQARAYSRDDFERWELSALRLDQTGPPVPIASGTTPVLGGVLAQWDSRTIDTAPVRLRLEARDTHGNVASQQVDFIVDNQPPAAPIGLVASESGSANVQLAWQANSETDLLGYLTYRGPRLLQGGTELDPRAISIAATAWLDESIGDGSFEWRVVAVDTTGNVSAFSDPASLTRSGRPPRVDLVRPLDGERFDTRTLVRGRSSDLDLVDVRFEARAEGMAVWAPFGPNFAAPPLESDFVPLPRQFGFYDLRAQSRDSEGHVDPAPPAIRVEHVDLTAPTAPIALDALVDGAQVALTWSAVDAPDLAGYQIERAGGAGDFSLIVELSGAPTSHVDAGLTDGDYRYRVRAVDEHANRSQPSPVATARIYAPELSQPFTPTLDTTTSVLIQSPVGGQLELSRQWESGSAGMPEQPISAGSAASAGVPLEQGMNTLRVRVRDAIGNRSRSAEIHALRSQVPPVPTDLAAQVNGHQVALGWQSVTHPYPLGYRVFRDGIPVHADQPLSPQSLTLRLPSGVTYPIGSAADGNPNTRVTLPIGSAAIEINAGLAEPQSVVAIELDFASSPGSIDGLLDAQWQGVWVRVPTSLVTDGNRVSLATALPYRSTQFRLRMTGPEQSLQLAELRMQVRPVQTANALSETLADGRFRYRVSTVNAHAFESAPTDPLDVDVGDAVPPDPVVLSGSVVGADARLTWTESNAADLAQWWVMRGSTRIATITDVSQRAYTDAGLLNGSYGYRVLAVDAVGNASTSNLVVLSVDVGNLPAPINLTVEAVAGGGALSLAWLPGPGSTPVGYRIKRALAAAGPYQTVADVGALTAHIDSGLVNGTRYHYRVQARDAVGNLSADSDPASGIPVNEDPVITPVFHFPTTYGRSVVVPEPFSVVAGRGQPGSTVHIGLASRVAVDAVVPTTTQTRSYYNDDVALPSPDGRHVLLPYSLRVIGEQTARMQFDTPCAPGQWSSAHRLLVCESTGGVDRVSLVALESLTQQTILESGEIRLFRLSDDGRRLLVGADVPGGASGLELAWREQLPVGEWQRIPGVDVSAIDADSVRFNATGRWAMWIGTDSRLTSFDFQTGQLREYDLEVNSASPGLSKRDPRAIVSGSVGGQSGVYLVELESGVVQLLGVGPDAVVGVDFSGNDGSVGVLSDTEWHLLRWPDLSELASVELNGGDELHLLGTEEWAIGLGYSMTIVQPAGVFTVPALALERGDNVVAAIATAPGQLDSTPALPITITVPADGLPDLSVHSADITTLPNVGIPGSNVRVGARIRNRGSATAAPAVVRLQIARPSGALLPPLTANTPAIAANAEATVLWQTTSLADSGVHALTVSVNSDRSVPESSFANNTASRLFTVSADGRPELVLNTDRAVIGPAESLHGVASVVNAGSAFSGQLQLRILDDQNHLVAHLQQQALTLTSPGATVSVPFQWTPGTVSAGRYQVSATLVDHLSAPVRTQTVPVDVRAESLLLLSLSPSQQSVSIGGALQLQASLRYAQGNTLIDNAELRSRLVNSGGLTVASDARALTTMSPGFEANYALAFSSGSLAPGAYTVISEVWTGALLAEGGAVVHVVQGAAAPAVSGHWLLPPDPLAAGHAASIDFEVRNTGPVGLTDLPIRARVRRQVSGEEVARIDVTWALAPGESRTAEITIPSSAMTIGGLILSLEVSGGSLARMLDLRAGLVADVEPPILTTLRPVAAAVINGRFEVQLRVLDAHSSVTRTEIRYGDGPYQAMSPGAAFAGEFRANANVQVEGPLTLQARAHDAFGNVGLGAPWSVVIDNTAPVISISGVSDGAVYASAVTPVIQVSDAHPVTVVTQLNGQNYVSGTSLVDDGVYSIVVVATDIAGNRAQVTLSFEIDTRAPNLAFTFPAANAVIAATATEVRLATEGNAQVSMSVGGNSLQAQADANGQVSFAAVALVPGQNLLRAVAVDRAGNASPTVEHTVVRSGATVGLFSGAIQPLSITQEPGPDLVGVAVLSYSGTAVLDDVASRLSLVATTSGQTIHQMQWSGSFAPGTINPRPFEFSGSGLTLGSYLLVLESQLTDTTGQLVWTILGQAAVTIADLSPPEIDLLSPQSGQVVPAQVDVEATVSDLFSPIDSVGLLVDQGAAQAMVAGTSPLYLAQSSVLVDGEHTLAVRATDQAGNQSTAPQPPRSVLVDGTPPAITISGVEEGQLSAQPLAAVITIAEPHPGSSQVLLDGAPYVSGNVIGSDGSHLLRVEATDLVGNHAEREVRFTIDRTPPPLAILEPINNTTTPLSHLPLVASTEPGAEVELLDVSAPYVLVSDPLGLVRIPAVWLTPGENILRVRAHDRAGNQSQIASVRVLRLVSNTAPVDAVFTHAPAIPHGQLFAGTLTVTSTLASSPHVDELRMDVVAIDQTSLARLEWNQMLVQGQALELPFSLSTLNWPAERADVKLYWRRMTTPTVGWTLIAASSVNVLDQVPPDLIAVAPEPGAVVPNPIPVRVHASDALTGVATVSARIDNEPWIELTVVTGSPGEWLGNVAALQQGIRMLSFRALDGAGNSQILGPIPVCRDDNAVWQGFADGFEAPSVSTGFENGGCASASPQLKRAYDWLTGLTADRHAGDSDRATQELRR